MTVLVAYASRHGSTAGIAERIAAGLRAADLPAEALPVQEVDDVARYDAVVIGAAAYTLHWLKDATSFVRRHRGVLAERPVWLFSSGPLGTDLVGKDGRDVRETSRPKEFAQLEGWIHPRGERIFFGAWAADEPAIGIEKMLRFMPKARAAIPVGDFRDWPEIDAWAVEIVGELRSDESR